MRVLLEEGVPRKLKWRFGAQHTVATVRERGWNGTKNGALLHAAEGEFDVLLTVDKRLRYQQNVSGLSLAVVVFDTGGTTYADLLPLMPAVEQVLETIRPGEVALVAG
jgi:hypothetical protein